MAMLAWLMLLAAQAPNQPADPCSGPDGATACREIRSIRIEGPSGETRVVDANTRMPWVIQENVTLIPGESVTVRLERSGAGLVPTLVRGGAGDSAPEPRENEVRLSLSEIQRGQITMTVLSRYPEMLDYAALINVYGRGPERTSVCALMPGAPVIESWSVPIVQMAVWSFRPTTEAACRIVTLPRPS
jgi:hypothetical protein